MEQVFAPWRIDWVEREEHDEEFENCVFCELPTQEADREHNLLARGKAAYVLLNNFPYNPGHAMVIPYEHVGSFQELTERVLLDQGKLLQRTLTAMDGALDPDGYNIGYNLGGPAAGGSIADHLHAHVVPRWTGDTNFMPVCSDTKVIVEAVAETYDRLHESFGTQDGATRDDPAKAIRVEG